MNHETPFHLKCLADELKRRQERNPRYSLRSYARSLSIDPSSLSRMLNGKQDLSLHLGAKVIQQLSLSEEQAQAFVRSVADEARDRALAFLSRSLESAKQARSA